MSQKSLLICKLFQIFRYLYYYKSYIFVNLRINFWMGVNVKNVENDCIGGKIINYIKL